MNGESYCNYFERDHIVKILDQICMPLAQNINGNQEKLMNQKDDACNQESQQL